ncbi:unnamed protein product, partial [Didymodactylos carnosus]
MSQKYFENPKNLKFDFQPLRPPEALSRKKKGSSPGPPQPSAVRRVGNQDIGQHQTTAFTVANGRKQQKRRQHFMEEENEEKGQEPFLKEAPVDEKLGSGDYSDHLHWAHEIVKRTKTRDTRANKEFCVNQMNRLKKSILTASNEVTRAQGELAMFVPAMLPGQTSRLSNAGVAQQQPERSVTAQFLFAHDILRKYIQSHTQYVARKCANRVAIADAEQAEFAALQLFEKRATPQQKAHAALLKPKLEALH